MQQGPNQYLNNQTRSAQTELKLERVGEKRWFGHFKKHPDDGKNTQESL